MTDAPVPAFTEQDAEHLRLLSIFHYVVAGLQGLFGCFPIFHFIIGAAVVFFPEQMGEVKGGGPPQLFGWVFMIFAGTWMAVAWSVAACLVVAGRSLAQRRRYLFCLVTAGIAAAMCMPFGTILGVFTIVVLVRPGVKAAFELAPP